MPNCELTLESEILSIQRQEKCLVTQYCHLPSQVRMSVSYASNFIHGKTLSDISIPFMKRKHSSVIFAQQDCEKYSLAPHQKVRTSELALSRRQKASEAQLSTERINLPIKTQHPTNLKWKIRHQESVTPSKHL